MTKLAPEWVRTSDPVIRSPARYRWTTAPARFPEWKTVHSPVVLVLYSSEIVSAQNLFLMVTIEVEKLPLLARYPPCTCPTLVTWIIARNVYGCHHSIPN